MMDGVSFNHGVILMAEYGAVRARQEGTRGNLSDSDADEAVRLLLADPNVVVAARSYLRWNRQLTRFTKEIRYDIVQTVPRVTKDDIDWIALRVANRIPKEKLPDFYKQKRPL